MHAKADSGRVIPHLAVRALVACRADEACVKALDGPYAEGALWALRYFHTKPAVDGLIRQLSQTREVAQRRAVLATLVRLYYREGDYTGGWWGTRPDTSGPYFDRQTWDSSPRIAAVLRTAVTDADPETAAFLLEQLARHHVKIDGLPNSPDAAGREPKPQRPIVIPKADPNNKNLIANMPYEVAAQRALIPGDAERGKALFTQQSCAGLPYLCRWPNSQGPAPGRHRQALQAARVDRIGLETQREDRPRIRHLRLCHHQRQNHHRLRRERKRQNGENSLGDGPSPGTPAG